MERQGEIMFCIKPLKPVLRNVVRLPRFDHADTFTFEVIPNLFCGPDWRSRFLRRLGMLPYKAGITGSLKLLFLDLDEHTD